MITGGTNELLLCGALFCDTSNEVAKATVSELREMHFCHPLAKAVFIATRELIKNEVNLDAGILLSEAQKINQDVTQKFAVELMNTTVTLVNYPQIINSVKEDYKRRRLSDILDSTSAGLFDYTTDIQKVHNELLSQLKELDEDKSEDMVGMLENMTDFYEYLYSDSSEQEFLPTQYNKLDKVLNGGLIREGLYILAARPGCGKTTFALQLADRVAKAGVSTLFVSLEMSVKQLNARLVAVRTGYTTSDILNRRHWDEDKRKKITSAISQLASIPLVFSTRKQCDLTDIEMQARKMKDCGLIVIDYLGLIKHKGGKSIYEKVTETSNDLKRLARTLKIPILCLAQLNRGNENQNRPPRLSDLRDSGAIEQDADGIMLLYSPKDDEELETKADALVLDVGKNRHGTVGKIDLNWYKPNGRIYE